MLGVINLDKPVGPTSHDMVALVRRLTGLRRIGHAGTLDPLASGVLPILVGPATRLSEELTGGPKRYLATIRLGSTSETDDAEGPVTAGTGAVPDEAAVRHALAAFVGTFDQRPPAFSARKQHGQIAHRAARTGHPLDLPARAVTIMSLELLSHVADADHADVQVDIRCGPGTYIRSLARDLGARLGCGGYLLALRRTEAAGLSVVDSLTPDELERRAGDGRLAEVLQPVISLLPFSVVDIDAAGADRFRHGQMVEIGSAIPGRVGVTSNGSLLGLGEIVGTNLQPNKVLVGTDE